MGYGGSGASAAYTYSVTAWAVCQSAGGGGGFSFIDTERITSHVKLAGSSSFQNVVGVTEIGNQRDGAIRIKQIDNIKGVKCTCNYDLIFTMRKLFIISTLISALLK
jgi:hypothetical protein